MALVPYKVDGPAAKYFDPIVVQPIVKIDESVNISGEIRLTSDGKRLFESLEVTFENNDDGRHIGNVSFHVKQRPDISEESLSMARNILTRKFIDLVNNLIENGAIPREFLGHIGFDIALRKIDSFPYYEIVMIIECNSRINGASGQAISALSIIYERRGHVIKMCPHALIPEISENIFSDVKSMRLLRKQLKCSKEKLTQLVFEELKRIQRNAEECGLFCAAYRGGSNYGIYLQIVGHAQERKKVSAFLHKAIVDSTIFEHFYANDLSKKEAIINTLTNEEWKLIKTKPNSLFREDIERRRQEVLDVLFSDPRTYLHSHLLEVDPSILRYYIWNIRDSLFGADKNILSAEHR